MEAREVIDGKGWTEERHAAFLNWMEESFVHRMLTPSGGGKEVAPAAVAAAELVWPGRECDPHLPLDRHIPDSATESTGDSQARPRPSRLLAESGNNNGDLVAVANTNRNRMTKRLLSQLDHAPLHQVVPLPQLGSIVDISMKKKRR